MHDWNIFTAMILATWIRRFTLNNPNANKVTKQWADVVSSAFAAGCENEKMQFDGGYMRLSFEMDKKDYENCTHAKV